MADAPLHYFAGQQALSLRALDKNTRHIAELERRITQYVGPDLTRFSREGLAFFTPEGAPDLPEGTSDPGPAVKKDSLWVPGILERIAFTEVYDAPCLQAGVAYIPLATQRMSSTAEGATMTAMPGAVRDVVYLDGLCEPLIDKGQVQLPLAQSYTADDAVEEQTAVAGGLCGVTCGECWEVRDGTVYVPTASTAATDAEGNTTPATPGVLRAVDVVPELQHPDIRAGVLRLPLADHDSAAGRFDIPGLIKRVEVDEALRENGMPRISAGVLRLPPMLVAPADMPSQVTGAISSLSCEGSEWTISQGVINIPLAGSASEGADGEQPMDAVPGVVQGIVTGVAVDGLKIDRGDIYLPYAQHYPEGGEESRPGLLAGCRWTKESGITEPYIWQGELVIPVPDVSDQQLTHVAVTGTSTPVGSVVDSTLYIHPAHTGTTGLHTPGVLTGVQYSLTHTAPTIENGVLKLPTTGQNILGVVDHHGNQCGQVNSDGYIMLYDANEGGSGVGGLLRGCEYDSGVEEPTFQSGVLKLPRPDITGGALLGLRDDAGNSHTWEQVEGYVGSQVQVAGLSLRLAENFYATFMLNVGIRDGYLTFNFSAE